MRSAMPAAASRNPSLARRLASMVYESLLVAALLLTAAGLFFLVAGMRIEGLMRHVFQAYLALVLGAYFVWCWQRSGQTLPMKVWKLRLVRHDGAAMETWRAVARYVVAGLALGTGAVAMIVLWRQPQTLGAWLALVPAALDFLWAVVDRERQFLHDRLVGTKVVSAAPPTTSSPPP
jgi:uncharacterized RDD family membrane protein YckC